MTNNNVQIHKYDFGIALAFYAICFYVLVTEMSFHIITKSKTS